MELMEIPYFFAMLAIKGYRMITWVIIKIIIRPLTTYIIRVHNEAGATINGPEPWHPRIHDDRFYFRVAQDKLLGVGESYMEGWWDCERLDEFFNKTISQGLFKVMMYPLDYVADYVQFQLFNLQTAKRSWEVAEKHYNLGNQLFEAFLDPSLNYSCGFWRDAKDLTEAQQHKMEIIGRKLQLKKGMRVLDIGCGWGGLCKFLSETYQVNVVGITVSKEGAVIARERCANLPVEIRVQDYRELNEKFDRIVSVGMFEHVGKRNYRKFMQVSDRCLNDGGFLLLHTIGIDNDFVPPIEPWVNKYIFPNGILPDHKEIPQAIDHIFTIEDWHNIGADYDKTLMAWHANFVKNWPTIQHLFDDPKTFYRMWSFYLQLGAGLFRSRKFHCWQIVLTKGMPGGYQSVR